MFVTLDFGLGCQVTAKAPISHRMFMSYQTDKRFSLNSIFLALEMVYFSLYSSGSVPLILLTCIWYLAIRRIWSIKIFGLGINPKHAGMEKDCSDNRGKNFKNHAVVSFQNVCVVLHSQERCSRVSTAKNTTSYHLYCSAGVIQIFFQ